MLLEARASYFVIYMKARFLLFLFFPPEFVFVGAHINDERQKTDFADIFQLLIK